MRSTHIRVAAIFVGVFLASHHRLHADLITRISFSETTGTTFADSIGSADASIVDVGANNVTLGGSQATLSGGAKADTDYISVPVSAAAENGGIDGQFTVELWATRHSIEPWSRIFSIGNGTGERLEWVWNRNSFAGNRFETRGLGANLQQDNVGGTYADDVEYHFAMTLEDLGSNLEFNLFVDGVLGATLTSDGTADGDDFSDLVLSQFNLGRSFFGDNTANASYNELRIHNNALSATQIASSFTTGPDSVTAVPEPSSALLLGTAMGGAVLWRRRKRLPMGRANG